MDSPIHIIKLDENGKRIPDPNWPVNKGGRPKGSRNLRSKESSKVLAQLGFDPIAEKVRVYDDCERKIRAEERKERPSMVFIAAMMAIKDKAANDLIRFGYAPIKETIDVNHQVVPPPLQVVTTPSGWKPGDPTPVNVNGGDVNMSSLEYAENQIPEETYPDYEEQGNRRLEEQANMEDSE